MVAQENTSGLQSNSVLSDNTNSMDVCAQSVMEEGLVPKIRKPYTISKQRERWTEEEHNKFLEALKLHGRAWRKIEEHLGTKTAVQIRSHAQKFFSKVVRETSNSNASSTEPIEIPPPRPKRKPSHPYPRKLVLSTKKDNPVPTDQLARSSVSPNTIDYEQQNQSPTSVLSGLGSDTLASADSATPNSSPSPADDINQAELELSPSCDITPQDDLPLSQSSPNDQVSVKLELFPNIDSVEKRESVATKVLKLFGKEVVIPNEPSDSSTCLSKSPSSDMGEALLQTSPDNFHPMETCENPWNCQSLYYVDGNGNHVEKPIPLPCWVFFRGVPVPPYECHVKNPEEKDTQREGSSAGSSSESVGNNDDAESQSGKDETPALPELRTITSNKGFVPYKRCYSERETQSSNACINEEEGRRIRLCL